MAGIALPPGDPGAVRDAANGLRGVGTGFRNTAETVNSAAASVSWSGVAASAFIGQTADYAEAGRSAGEASVRASTILDQFADRLEQGRERVRRLQEQAQEVQQRMLAAQAAAADAAAAESAAQSRAQSSMYSMSAVDAGATAQLQHDAAVTDANAAAAERVQQETRAAAAADELEQLRNEAEQEREAVEQAATSAAGRLTGAEDAMPVVAGGVMIGHQGAVEDRALAQIRAGDYSVMDGVPMNSLSEGVQTQIGSELAQDADEAAYNEGDQSIGEVGAFVSRFSHDGEFAAGFYNQLGGRGADEFVQNLTYFQGDGDGLGDPSLVAVMAPFATLLGTATRSGQLRQGFAGGFMRKDLGMSDRYPGHQKMSAFIQSGEASNYDPTFLADVGEEVLIAPGADPDSTLHNELSENQDLMEFIGGNPEAAGTLLAGTHGPDDHFNNAAPLLMYGPRYTDDGNALGALITAGTHDLRGTNLGLSNDASYAVIGAAPAFGDHMPGGAKPALVTILDDHITDFEYLATERAVPSAMDAPPDRIDQLSYEQGQDYLKMLFADDDMRPDTTTIIGERVGEGMYNAAAREDTSYAQRSGALAEMGVIALGEAELDSAEASDTVNGLAQTASGKLVGLTPPGRVPGFDVIAGEAFKDIFPTDAVEKSLEEQAARQVDELQALKRLSIATQVQVGHLPPEAIHTINLDGSPNVDFVSGPNGDQDVIRVDSDGDGHEEPLQWDLDRDGSISSEERQVTERELYDAGLGLAEPAMEGMTSLADERYMAANPPDIDDLSLPDGYDNNNPSGFEKAWEWPFDADGEGTIDNGSGDVVAHQDDLTWDPAERVYRLPIDGSSDELTYQRIDGEWERVVQVEGRWELAG